MHVCACAPHLSLLSRHPHNHRLPTLQAAMWNLLCLSQCCSSCCPGMRKYTVWAQESLCTSVPCCGPSSAQWWKAGPYKRASDLAAQGCHELLGHPCVLLAEGCSNVFSSQTLCCRSKRVPLHSFPQTIYRRFRNDLGVLKRKGRKERRESAKLCRHRKKPHTPTNPPAL